VKHSGDLGNLVEQRLNDFRGCQDQVATYDQQIFGFGQRSFRNVEKMGIPLATSTLRSFGDVGWYREDCASQLCYEPESFLCGKSICEPVGL